MAQKFLVIGGCGFLGSNIAAHLLTRTDAELTILDNLSRLGSSRNMDWLRTRGNFQFIHADVRNTNDMDAAIKAVAPSVIYHLAGQVAMTTSLRDPRLDFETNVVGSFNVLEAIRKYASRAALIYSSTNKVYGDLEGLAYEEGATRYTLRDFPCGIAEDIGLDFHSPYGCSKGAADQYMLDYSRMFGLDVVVFRHSSMYGSRQFATYDQGWVGWFCSQVLTQARDASIKPFTISGSGKQVRDLVHVDDIANLYLKASNRIANVRGNSFNIGGGMSNSLSVLELIEFLGNELGVVPQFQRISARESDQKVFVADIRKAERLLGWRPMVDWKTGLRSMIEWVSNNAQS